MRFLRRSSHRFSRRRRRAPFGMCRNRHTPRLCSETLGQAVPEGVPADATKSRLFSLGPGELRLASSRCQNGHRPFVAGLANNPFDKVSWVLIVRWIDKARKQRRSASTASILTAIVAPNLRSWFENVEFPSYFMAGVGAPTVDSDSARLYRARIVGDKGPYRRKRSARRKACFAAT